MSGFASICLLAYDRPKFLLDCIESLEHSNYPYELIVHDDGSTHPEQRRLLRRLLETNRISTLIQNTAGHNEGQGIALNRMFNMAKGDPIVKMDHDLILRPGWLAQSVLTLEENAKREQEPRIGALGLFKYHTEPVHHEEMYMQSWEGWEQVEDFVGSAMVIPRSAWERFGPFQERSEAFAEDWAFKMKIKEAGAWALGLLPHDYAINQGFGLGPSTVVVQTEGGELTSREIKKGPFVHGVAA
jgi:glycosyltransferase involved in cell wall biosynthesis